MEARGQDYWSDEDEITACLDLYDTRGSAGEDEAMRLEIELPQVLADEPAPQVAVVLGSGLARVAAGVQDARGYEYAGLGFPTPPAAAAGHEGRLLLGTLEGVRVAVFSGRFHLYQGVPASVAAYTARFAAALGARTLVVTNAAGGLDPAIPPGRIVLLRDHINLQAASPLAGWPGPEGGTPFVPMGDAYDPGLRALALATASSLGIELAEGVYAAVLGPAYETPAEVEYLRRIGADVVGMSTVPEVIAARALGLRVLGLSFVTNLAGGAALSHAEVLDAAGRAERDLERLLAGVLKGMDEDAG